MRYSFTLCFLFSHVIQWIVRFSSNQMNTETCLCWQCSKNVLASLTCDIFILTNATTRIRDTRKFVPQFSTSKSSISDASQLTVSVVTCYHSCMRGSIYSANSMHNLSLKKTLLTPKTSKNVLSCLLVKSFCRNYSQLWKVTSREQGTTPLAFWG